MDLHERAGTDFPERTFLITGASSTLGRAFVRWFSARPGVALAATTRGNLRCPALESRPDALWIPGADLLQPDHMNRVRDQVADFARGPLHVVNCVGHFPGFKRICETDIFTARRVYEENVLTVYSAAQALVPLMVERGGGHFVAFSSHSVYQTYPFMGAFASAKAAVETLVRAIANEHSRDGIIATALALATVDSAQERALAPHGDFEHWLKPHQICQFVDGMVAQPFSIMNGNTIHLYNYSHSYFGQAYFDRVGRDLEAAGPPE